MQVTTISKIREWLVRGRDQEATHVVVLCDTFDHTDYPVFAKSEDEARAIYKNPGDMTRVMEVYNLAMDWDAQLAETRAFHFATAPASGNKDS